MDFSYKDSLKWIEDEYKTNTLFNVFLEEDNITKHKAIGVGYYGVVIETGNRECIKVSLKNPLEETYISEYEISKELMSIDEQFFSRTVVTITDETVVAPNRFVEICFCHIILLNLLLFHRIPNIDEEWFQSNPFEQDKSLYEMALKKDPEVVLQLYGAIERSPIPINLFTKYSQVLDWCSRFLYNAFYNNHELYIWNMPLFTDDISRRESDGTPYLADKKTTQWLVFFVFHTFYESVDKYNILLRDLKPNNILFERLSRKKVFSKFLIDNKKKIYFKIPSVFDLRIADLQFIQRIEASSVKIWYTQLHNFVIYLRSHLARYQIENIEFELFANRWLSSCQFCNDNRNIIFTNVDHHITEAMFSIGHLKTCILSDRYFDDIRETDPSIKNTIPILRNMSEIISLL